MTRKVWSPGADGFLRHNYGRHPASWIARAMCRTAKSIYQRADLLGLTQGHAPLWSADEDARLVELNAAGNSDTEIARLMSRERHTITKHRHRLGLPDQSKGPQARAAVAAGVRRQLDRLGIATMNQLRVESWRKLAREHGWPDTINGRTVCHRHIQILDALWGHGPQTREQLAERIGLPWHGSRHTFKTKGRVGGSYLAELAHAGLVMRLGKIIAGQGKGHSVNLYALALDVEKGETHAG
jgi:hypothetical protein